MLNLGQKAVDSVTGFQGVITARTQYMTGCDRLQLEPEFATGTQQQPQWFDIDRLRPIRRNDTAEAPTKSAADEGCVGSSSTAESTEEKIKRPSLSPLLALAMASLGIVKVMPCDDRDCPVCSIARERGDTPRH